jgi:hypothetical protein
VSASLFALLALPIGLISAPLCLWLRLRFYRHIYDCGGAKDLEVAARAVHPRIEPSTEASSRGEVDPLDARRRSEAVPASRSPSR